MANTRSSALRGEQKLCSGCSSHHHETFFLRIKWFCDVPRLTIPTNKSMDYKTLHLTECVVLPLYFPLYLSAHRSLIYNSSVPSNSMTLLGQNNKFHLMFRAIAGPRLHYPLPSPLEVYPHVLGIYLYLLMERWLVGYNARLVRAQDLGLAVVVLTAAGPEPKRKRNPRIRIEREKKKKHGSFVKYG